MKRMLRGLLACILGLSGVALVLGLLIWWLAQRRTGGGEPEAFEIQIPPGAPLGEVPVFSSAAPLAEAEAEPEAEVEAPTEAPAEGKAEVREAAQEAGPDDLRKIEGIGPKISRVLQAAGITTFAKLAATGVDEIERILEAKDPRLGRLADPGTWPEQARLAAAGDWEGLAALQGELKGGRRVAK